MTKQGSKGILGDGWQSATLLGLFCGLAVLGAGCGEDTTTPAAPTNPYAGYKSERYSADALWLCRPGLAVDQCLTNSLDATEILADGTTTIAPHQAAADPAVDCFYIYPTVDLTFKAGNHTDFSDLRPMLDPLLSQAARFTRSCRVFAPLYRQATIGSYGSDSDPFSGSHADIFNLAYSDVIDAFRHYMGQYNNGRRVIIMGHSQGTHMLTRLLSEEIDDVPDLRRQLVVALLIGGNVEVPVGGVVGGTFRNLPLCTSSTQTQCVIAYRTYAAAFPPATSSNGASSRDRELACTNPAALASGGAANPATVSAAYFPLMTFGFAIQPVLEGPMIHTPFASYPDFYTAECAHTAKGFQFLAIGAPAHPGDPRVDPIPYNNTLLSPGIIGTHILDYNFPLGDLLHLADTKIAAGQR